MRLPRRAADSVAANGWGTAQSWTVQVINPNNTPSSQFTFTVRP